MSGAVKREQRREYCKDCRGEGSTFTTYAYEGNNPSVKSRWMTCDRCGGDGLEPLDRHGDEDGDT